jgi:hypothetical protein
VGLRLRALSGVRVARQGMGRMASREDELMRAVDLALVKEWEEAHAIAQRHEGDAAADWLHAVLHKIEGDNGNARYWYRRTQHSFEEFADPSAELAAIRALLER